jgi:hypothetical protein
MTRTHFRGKEGGPVSQALPAPTSSHAAEAFLVAHAAPGPWSAGTAVKYAGQGPDSLRQLAGSDQIQ